MTTLSELERKAYKEQNKLALAVFNRLDFLYFRWQDDKNHPLEVEKQTQPSGETHEPQRIRSM